MDMTGRHPATIRLARRFVYAHLPEHLQGVSRPFADLAALLLAAIPDSPELSEALRKLWEAKNCAVLAATLDRPPTPPGGSSAFVTELSRTSLHEAARLLADDPAA